MHVSVHGRLCELEARVSAIEDAAEAEAAARVAAVEAEADDAQPAPHEDEPTGGES